jgi:hypothetical protein
MAIPSIKQKVAFSALALMFAVSSNAQTNPYVPTVVPPSPNAASLAKCTDVPISSYTGAADVSVPIYTVQARGVSVPINLSYHTGGIRLKEEAGWVGLGWSLSSGGVISRQIRDKDDFGGQYFTTAVPQITDKNILPASAYQQPPLPQFGIYGYDFFCNYLVNTSAGTIDFSGAWPGGSGLYDKEADLYNFSLPSGGGKFIVTRAGVVLMQKQENYKISYESSGNSFTISDDQGNKYLFADKEYTNNPSGVGYSVSSWYLSRIISQLNDTVKFSYLNDATYTNVVADISQVNRVTSTCIAGISSSQGPTTSYLNVTLSTIDFSNGQLQFSFDNLREDLQNGKKLNNIKLFSKDAVGNLIYQKEEKLFYSYFYPGLGYEYERLRLDSVKEAYGNISLPPYAFSYNYNSPSFAGKHSYAVDHWGYFNGQGGNSTYIPGFNDYVNMPAGGLYYTVVTGANREPDATSAKLFSLNQIQYPTGGKTALEYESNDYDFDKSINGQPEFIIQPIVDTVISLGISARGTATGTIDMSKLYGIQSGGLSPNASLTVSFRNANNGGNTAYRGTNGKIYFNVFGVNTDISNTNVSCPGNLPICSSGLINVSIQQATKYTWTAYIDPTIGADFMDIDVMITWHELKRVHTSNPTLLGGGLRVKSVTELNIDNTPIKKRRYDYGLTEDRLGTGSVQSYTYGRLMSMPTYARYEIAPGGSCKPGLTLTGTSNSSITSVNGGNIVGYDQVAEYNVDPLSGANIGKTIYYYFGGSDTLLYCGGFRLPGVSNITNSLYGSLIKKEVYKNDNGIYQKVQETDNFYHSTNRTVCWDMKTSFLSNTVGFSAACPSGICVPSEYYINFTPSIKSEKVLLDSTKEIIFDQAGNGNSITNAKNFFYDNQRHFQPSRIRFVDSKGNTIVSYTKYPQDYIPNGLNITGNTILDSLIGRNMLAEKIEGIDSLYYSGSSTGYVTGAQLSTYKLIASNTLAIDRRYNLDVQSPLTNFQGFAIIGNSVSQDSRYRQMVSMDNYDNLNNLRQYTATDQLPVTVLWDYKQLYPIAQVKNANNNEVAYTSFEAEGTGNWVLPDTVRNRTNYITGSQSYNLSSGKTITTSALTLGKTYIVSYWSMNGTLNVNGVSATSGLSKQGWTYYQHLLPSTTSAVTITGVATIDELRLSPANAKMTTYCYIPLMGISSICSVNNMIQSYIYDPFGRLKQIKDMDGNIVKTIEYHYQNQIGF